MGYGTGQLSRGAGMTENLPPVKIAFVLDGVVQDILHMDDRLAAIFLSEPTVVDVSDDFGMPPVQVGDLYDPETVTFITPTAN